MVKVSCQTALTLKFTGIFPPSQEKSGLQGVGDDFIDDHLKESGEVKMDAAESNNLMDIDAVQKILNRSRASIYRYTNTDPDELNPPYDPQRLNPELRTGKGDPLLFHPTEVARFAQEVLGLKPVTIEVKESPQTVTIELLKAILGELQEIRSLLQSEKPQNRN